jgi:hypothetical protein
VGILLLMSFRSSPLALYNMVLVRSPANITAPLGYCSGNKYLQCDVNRLNRSRRKGVLHGMQSIHCYG